MFKKNKANSLEDAIRGVQQKYRGRPSPLSHLYENVGYTPTQMAQAMPKPSNPRDALLGGFKPLKDTFR